MKRAAVVGSGVVGVTSAIRLLEAGWKVTLISETTTPFTTSDGSAAIWFPFLAQPLDKVTAWSKVSYEILCQQAAQPNAADLGVEMRSGYEFYTSPLNKDPDFAGFVRDFRRVKAPELPAKYKDGIFCTVPVAIMTSYMRYLMITFSKLGGINEVQTVSNLAEIANSGRFDVVVNCTGLGARALLGDSRVKPLRGQIMRVHAPQIKHFYFDENDPDNMTYIIPRADLIVLGGTAQLGDFSTAIRASDAEGIRKRCAELEPSLATAPLVTHWAGLRPFRDAVRVELERGTLSAGDGSTQRAVIRVPVVHNYGHGGSGVTIAWGCAVDVVRLAAAAVAPAKL